MIRRVVGAGVLTLLLAASATAATPEGPRLAFLQFVNRPDALVMATGDASMQGLATVAGGGRRARPLPYPLSGPAWSPSGSTLAFSGMTGPGPGLLSSSSRQIYLVEADGTGIRAIPRTRGGSHPVFFPDGRRIAFARSMRRILNPDGWFSRPYWKSVSVWSVGLDGSGLRQLTEWANGVENLPSSFAPDGSVLGITHRDVFRDRADATALRLGDGRSYVLRRSASWPKYSPDGSRIAYLGIRRVDGTSCCELGDGYSIDLFAMDSDRSSRRRLTDTPLKAERPPSWDPSGERLAYTTKSAPTETSSGDLDASVMQINADGTCLSRLSTPVHRVRGHRITFHFPAWQPGPGRGAGRIEC